MKDEINERIASTRRLFNAMKSFLSKKEILKDVKVEIVKQTLIYSCESLILTDNLKSNLTVWK